MSAASAWDPEPALNQRTPREEVILAVGSPLHVEQENAEDAVHGRVQVRGREIGRAMRLCLLKTPSTAPSLMFARSESS
jgi:hypothetical protein